MSNICLIAFGTFGNPNGFTQTFFLGNPIKGIKAFDIRGSILIYPQSKLYSIRKEYKDGYNMIAYAIYTYAQEPTSARGGSFIGSSILFVDKIAEENIIIQNLNEFHKNLVQKNVHDDTITVNHSDKFDVKDCKPKDFDKLNFNLREIDNLNFIQTTNKNLVVFCRTNDNHLQSFFKKSVDLLNVYDTIFFTDSKEVAEFVRHKRIFSAVDENNFETEIRKLTEERKRKIQESLDEFSKEKLKLEESRLKTYEDFKSQIEKNKEKHQENDQKIRDSEKDLNKINEFYNSFSRKIDELSNQLKSGKKLDDVKQVYNDSKRVFRESIGSLKAPNFINAVSQPRPTTDIRETFHPKHNWNNQYEEKEERKYKLDNFKVATLVLSILLLFAIIGLVWFQFFKKPEKEIVYNESQEEQTVTEQPIKNVISEINPKPNGEVDFSTKNKINGKLVKNSKIDSVTNFIFKANPSSINEYYKYQKKDYSNILFEKNKESFKISSSNDTLYIKDLQTIPNYQK